MMINKQSVVGHTEHTDQSLLLDGHTGNEEILKVTLSLMKLF